MKNRKTRKRVKVSHLIILALVVYIGIIFIKQQSAIKELEEEKLQKQHEIERLNSEIMNIEEKLKYTDSLEYIEKMAREELKMVKPDEIIIIDTNKNKDKNKSN